MRGRGITGSQGATFVMPSRALFIVSRSTWTFFPSATAGRKIEKYQCAFHSAFLRKIVPH